MTMSCITIATQAQADLVAVALRRELVSFKCDYYAPDPDNMCPLFNGFVFCVDPKDLPRLSAAVDESQKQLPKPVSSHWLLDR